MKQNQAEKDLEVIFTELRRLSPMEAQNLKLMDDLFLARAQLKEREALLENYRNSVTTSGAVITDLTAERDKLLEVNKVLVDALQLIRMNHSCGAYPLGRVGVDAIDEAIKLAGEIK